MTSPYISNSSADRTKMLKSIGVSSVDQLFDSIPAAFRLNSPVKVPGPFSEFELKEQVDQLVGNIAPSLRRKNFLGAGLYDHYSPTIVNQLTLRGEFLTSYTPYQPEISQGTLQVLFEFQTMIASLMGMDIANASHYDGATSLADGVLMALRAKKSIKHILVAPGLHPDYFATMKTYQPHQAIEMTVLKQDEKTGAVDLGALSAALSSNDKGSCLLVLQSPNYLGVVEPMEKIATLVNDHEAFFIDTVIEPLSLGMLKSPGEWNADVAVGEGQSLGLPPSFGGPLVGLFATKNDYLRQIPGRLCGLSKDADGFDAYTLTLSTREQHIRREKATSNICTNQNLCAVMVSIYLSLLGKNGIKELAEQNLSLSEYLKSMVPSVNGASLPYQGPTFNEFVVRLHKPAKQVAEAAYKKEGVILGLPLHHVNRPNDLLVAVTETKRKDDLNHWITALKSGINA